MDTTLRNAVWQQLLDAERLVRYYGELTDRYRRWQRIPRYLMGASSVVGAAAIMFETDWIPNAVFLPAFLLIIAAVVWDFMHDHVSMSHSPSSRIAPALPGSAKYLCKAGATSSTMRLTGPAPNLPPSQ